MKAELVRIGNSCGLRIPRKLLAIYGIEEGDELELEELRDGILIKPGQRSGTKISWESAYKEMAEEGAERAEWAEWDLLAGDGLSDLDPPEVDPGD
jgi:antitoxin component of MazEF toxin-antitoxin module